MNIETMKVKSVFSVVVTMILHGWWKVRFHGHTSYMSDIRNAFGPGYWSWRKFSTCGKIISGYWTTTEDGTGKLFHGGPWEYQEMFLEEAE